MEQAKFRGLLAFSAILALVSLSGWTQPSWPDRPLQPGSLESPKPDSRQAGPEADAEEAPAREEKSDCDDCVIVLPERESAGDPETTTAGSSGMAGAGHLAGTLWGLFMVARPKRMPRTIIRGVTVP